MDYVTVKPSSLDFLKSFNWDENSWVSGDQKPTETKSVKSVWEELAEGTSSIGHNIWDAAKGAWISTKETASEVYTATKSEIASVSTGVFDYAQNKIIILALVLIAILYIAGKSGLFSAVVAVAK